MNEYLAALASEQRKQLSEKVASALNQLKALDKTVWEIIPHLRAGSNVDALSDAERLIRQHLFFQASFISVLSRLKGDKLK